MKKLWIVLFVIALIVSATLSVSATEITGNTYHIDNVTVFFDANSQFSAEQQEVIANLIANPEYGVARANLICNLFGHKNTSETVISITHKALVEAPRCFQENFTITNCSRCNETTVERNSYGYIFCCPED